MISSNSRSVVFPKIGTAHEHGKRARTGENPVPAVKVRMKEGWLLFKLPSHAPNPNLGAFLMTVEEGKKQSQREVRPVKRLLFLALSLVIGLVLWTLLARLLALPAFILPGPGLVWARFLQSLREGQLIRHFLVTLMEVLSGLFIGGLAASLLGYLLAKSPTLEKLASPYLVASQSIPMVAIAPLLVIWFGPGIPSKILICSLTVFFPILVNTVVGLREVPQDLRDLMRSLQASKAQIFWKLEVPAALPIFLGGLRVGATLSVIGAVVGELVGSDRGLGFLINIGRGQYDTALVFVAVITLSAMAMALYSIVLLIETRLLSWQSWRDDAL
jgi:NitT/TauT family transport system permease protein